MGVWYSLFVRSFADANGDGIGDMRGLINKLDYFSELQIEGLWLLPIFKSPSYHKYDTLDYFQIEPEYGTMQDFEELVFECRKRNIKLLLDLVINHISKDHFWFQQAVSNESNYFHNWFVWRDTTEVNENEKQYWHQHPILANKSYFGFFWEGMPDLNYDHPDVRKQAIDIAKFWLAKGIDGFRLDAAMHIYPTENEKQNHSWWKEFRAAIQPDYPNAILIGEITEKCEFISDYLPVGLNAGFNFELADKIIHAIENENHYCLVDWLKYVDKLYSSKSKNSFDAIFLSNHDQTRIASRLNNNSQKIKLAASILLTLPGVPFIYYGEELGMLGNKPDEYIREPFIWSYKDAKANCKWVAPLHSTKAKIKSLEEQRKEDSSIFNHYKKLLAIRANFDALNLGKIGQVFCNESHILIYTLSYKEEEILIIHNINDESVLLKNEDEVFQHFGFIFGRDDISIKNGEIILDAFSTQILKRETLSDIDY